MGHSEFRLPNLELIALHLSVICSIKVTNIATETSSLNHVML